MSSGVEKQQDSALEDGSEYHITFPYPLPTVVSADGCKIASDGNLSRKKTDTTRKEPIVILLGWAGCIDKILAAYSAIYNENGCVTCTKDKAYGIHRFCLYEVVREPIVSGHLTSLFQWVYRHVVQFPTRTLLNSYNPQLVQLSTRTILKSYNPQLVQSSSRPWSTRTTCTNKRNVLHFIVILLNINIITSTANVG